MSRRMNGKNLITLVVLLILAGIPTSSLAYFHSPGNHSLNPNAIKQPSPGTDPQLGFDCGLGSTAAILNGTSFPVAPSETGLTENLPSCTWIGDVGQTAGAANDGTTEPLVTDQDETFSTVSTAIGGGFTADVVYLQTATSATNGFDITINWNPKVLQLAKFDQSGLPWLLDSPFTQQSTIDNSIGQIHVVQVIFVHQGGDVVFFRLRFDVVGVGNSALTISNDVITNPGAIVHTTVNGAFDSETFFDAGHTLNWLASFTNSTPIIPGASNQFTATVTGGTSPYTFAWDFNSDGTTDSTSNPANIVIPTATLTGHRIKLTVTDSALNVITLVRRLPLIAVVSGPQGKTTTSVGTLNTFTADWLGGNPPYTGSWRFCPGSLAASVACSAPAPAIASQAGQINTRTVTYTRAGVYTDTLKITDTASPVFPTSVNTVTLAFLVNVTGTPQAYALTLSANPTSTAVGQQVQYNVVAAYSTGYTANLRSSTISVQVFFGDGTSATSVITMATGGANSTSVTHTYLGANASPGFTVLAVGQETASNAVSAIQEVSNRISEVVNTRSTTTGVVCGGPATVGTPVTCTATVTDSATGTSSTPKGTVSFASDSSGTFVPTACNLIEVTPVLSANCMTSYTPTAAGSGTHTITGTYNGDPVHSTSQGTTTISVSGGTPTVTVNPPTPNPANTGQTVTVTFTVSSATTVTGITVNWGDGSAIDSLPGTATSDTHTYASTGAGKSQVFTITVTATNSAGSGSGQTMETVNDRVPVVTVTNVSPNPANTGQLVTATFTATDPDGTVSSITVNWGDGSAVDTLAGTATSDTHTYTIAGPFTITVTATDNSGSTGQNTGSVVVQTPVNVPTVTVNAPTPNPANTGATVTVTFTVTSSVTVTGITVNWGDGTTPDSLAGTATSDTHTYANTGSAKSQVFTITVTATNSAGPGSGTTTETVNDRPPTVTISSINPTSPCVGQSVKASFTSTDPDGTVASVSVNWGDSTPADNLPGTATSDTHTYTVAGTFTLTITGTDNSGSTGQATGSVTTAVAGCVPTVTVNSPTPKPATTGQMVTVTFTVSSPLTVTGITVNWGDGTTADSLPGTATSDTHTYASTGASTSQVFTITVTATNSAGPGSGTTTETVNDRPPTATVSNVSPNPANTGQLVTVTFATNDPDGTVSSISVNWGDGTTADTLPGTATSDTHTYAVGGPFTITVTATDNGGSTGQGTGSITVNVPVGVPTVTVNSPTPNPANTGTTVTVTFTVSSTVTVTGITVNWGDGSAVDSLPGTATSDTHTYASTGASKSQVFTITVTATNSAGPGSGTTTETINDRPPTVTVTNVSPNPANTGQLVTATFTATDPDGTISSITVNWGDGSAVDTLAGTATSDTHTYTVAGPFTITVAATDNGGSTGQGTGTITVQVPVGVPTVTVNTPTPNPANTGQIVTVTFTVSSSVTVTGISVNWGDGTTADSLTGTATSDTHTYASTGNLKSQTFTITVTATNSAGPGSGQTTETVNDRPPTVLVTNVSPNPANTGQLVTVTFTTSDPDGTVSSISVNWGDGTTADSLAGTATSDTHTYLVAGPFTITVTATDNSGSTGQATGTITIQVPVGAPTVTVNAPTPNPASTGQMVTVTFTVSSTVTVSGITVNWGDGTAPDGLAGTATSDTHTYASTGNLKSQTFTITVTATNSAGSGSGTAMETVNDRAPTASFTFTPASPNAGQTISFDASASADPDGTIASYAWDFGDGTTGTGVSPTHTYNPASTMSFTVKLTVTDNSGNTGSTSQTVTVTVQVSPPTVTINNVAPNPANTGQTVTVSFTVSSTATVTGVIVNWGDGTTDSLAGTASSDTHSYTSTGPFTITVTATNSAGSGSATASITVTSPSGAPIMLTFQAFNFSSFHNGIGPLTVLVNGHVVADFPGHGFVSSSSTVVFGTDKFVTLGPFDITQFVIQGQNNVTFVNTFGIRFSLIRNIMVTQGDTTFLNFKGPRFIAPGRPLTLTFSNPPLVITSFTASSTTPVVGQNITFTATFTGGTAPFICKFRFGDDSSTTVPGTAGMCSVTHVYDDSGNMTARVTITGSSTSDKVTANLKISVSDLTTDSIVLATALGSSVSTRDDD